MDRCAKDVHELIEYLGLEDVTLLGWSMGSSVVMEYYEQFGDEHLKKIGVIDSALYPFRRSPGTAILWRASTWTP